MAKKTKNNPGEQGKYTKNNAIESLKSLAIERTKDKYPNVPDHCVPSPKYTDRTSNGLTKCVIDFITLNGGQAERISSTGRIIDQRKNVRGALGNTSIGGMKWIKPTSTNGTADISATIKGRSVKIEVKCKATGDRYQSEGQKRYQKQIEDAGGVYVIARTFQGFYEWYNAFIERL